MTDDLRRRVARALYEHSFEGIGYAGCPPPRWDVLDSGAEYGRSPTGELVPPEERAEERARWYAMADAALGAVVLPAPTAEALLRQIVSEDPLVTVGYMDAYETCSFCSGEEYFAVGNVTRDGERMTVIVHDADCPWVLGRRLLGLPLDPDQVVVPGQPTPDTYRVVIHQVRD